MRGCFYDPCVIRTSLRLHEISLIGMYLLIGLNNLSFAILYYLRMRKCYEGNQGFFRRLTFGGEKKSK